MLGVATLIVVLSVMNGFERELRTRMLAVTSHATIMGLKGTLANWQDVQEQVQQEPGVQAAVPYIEEPGDARQRATHARGERARRAA